MTKHNVGSIDRGIRLTLAAALFSLFFVLDGGLQWLALVGVVPLVTGLLGSCPLYSLFGVSTCPLREQES